MTRIERRVLLNCVLVGTLLTGCVVCLELGGWLSVPENWMYDMQARYFQYFSAPPTDQLVHLDIDDKAIEGIGRWPWPRSTIASMVDELHTAGARAIGMDVLFSDPQAPEYLPAADGSGKITKIDHDAVFVEAVKRAGNVLLPASFELHSPKVDPLYALMLTMLTADIELNEREVINRVHLQFAHDNATEARLPDLFIAARREAVYQRIERELTAQSLTPEDLRQRLIKRQDASVNSPLSRLIDEQRLRYQAVNRLMFFGEKAPSSVSAFIPAKVNLPVVESLEKAIAATAFVDFTTSRDGVLRTQPLMLECQGRLFPQMGLSLALLYLGASPRDVTFTSETATIACPGGRRIVLPVSQIHSETLDRDVPAIFNVPWFGSRQWETMYDWPDHRLSLQHISMNGVAEIGLTRRKIATDNASVDKALPIILSYTELLKDTPTLPPLPTNAESDALSRMPRVTKTLEHLNDRYEFDTSVEEKDLPEELRAFVHAMKKARGGKPIDANSITNDDLFANAVRTLDTVSNEIPTLKQQLDFQERALRDQLHGKAVLIGWTATGHQDAVPTPLHASCPGVITHGAIFNAIITGHTWSVAPEWITIAFTISLGWMTAVIAWRFSPLGAFCITSVFGMSYVALNGLFFFDHHGEIIGLASPQIAMGVVWSGCSLARIVIESSERQRIIRRFRSYVDPNVVNYMMERPDEVRMDGEMRELTVCFSDIAGFTALSEKLGEGIVPMLNEIMNLLVPIIRNQHGTVDKFLGDGIMFFFGAPLNNNDHAADAVSTALLMQQALGPFNQELLARGLPPVKVRIGINTGKMVVGDAGSDDAADYTVLGDAVNFASRLESANKQVGTTILLSGRTAELAGERFLLRPIGSLQVVGQSKGVPTFTVVGLSDGADSKDLELCRITRLMIESFQNRDFVDALRMVDRLEESFDRSPLTKVYRARCEHYIDHPPDESFDGTITLSEK